MKSANCRDYIAVMGIRRTALERLLDAVLVVIAAASMVGFGLLSGETGLSVLLNLP